MEKRSAMSRILYPIFPKKDVRGFLPIDPYYIRPGEEVLWVPDTVETIHDVREGGVQRGFITMASADKKKVWCRFFLPDKWELRTLANSELVKPEDLCWWTMLGRERIVAIAKEFGIRLAK